jgi:hypothetical protein
MSFSTAMARPMEEKRPCSKGSRETVPLTDYDLSPRMVLISFSMAMPPPMKEKRPSSKGSRETVPLILRFVSADGLDELLNGDGPAHERETAEF